MLTIAAIVCVAVLLLSGYFTVGYRLGRPAATRYIVQQRARHAILYDPDHPYLKRHPEEYNPSMMYQDAGRVLATWTLFWPIRGVARAINTRIQHELVSLDPKEHERRLLQQERRIAELERELDIR